MKFNLRETFLITLLTVAIVPLVALSIINFRGLYYEQIQERDFFLKNYAKEVYNSYKDDERVLRNRIKDISLILDKIDYNIDVSNRAKLQEFLENIKASSGLDMLLILDTRNMVIARANSKKYGDLFNPKINFKAAISGETVIDHVIIPDNLLKHEGKKIIAKTYLSKLENNKIKIIDHTKGLFLVGLVPFYGVNESEGKINGVIFAAKVLNQDHFIERYGFKEFKELHIAIQPSDITINKKNNMVIKRLYTTDNKAFANILLWLDTGYRSNELRNLEKTAVFITILATILVFIIAFYAAKYLARPLQNINNQAKEISKGNYDIEAKPEGPVEIRELSESFNNMSSSLAEKRNMQENFIATLTHDMRVPLLAEEKAIDLLRNDDRFMVTGEQKILLEGMVSSNQDLLKLVNTLLDSYKLEAGKYELNLKEYKITNILEAVIRDLTPLTVDKKQKLSFENNIKDSDILKIDKDEIKRVFTNLLSNAIKFTPSEGKININIYDDSKNIIIAIKDTGKGLSKEEEENLFNRYFSGSKKLRKVGTGLGLYLSYQIVLAHQGTMWVESEKGQGATFFISLPKQLNVTNNDIEI